MIIHPFSHSAALLASPGSELKGRTGGWLLAGCTTYNTPNLFPPSHLPSLLSGNGGNTEIPEKKVTHNYDF